MTVILLTNDDGVDAEGLRILEKVLQGLAHVVTVAPDQERSAVSHGLTLYSHLRLTELAPNRYVLNGTPADCVIFALQRLFSQFPDLVISGINHGANLGDDIMYSGTVAAAREAACHGVPAMAISQMYLDNKPIHFEDGAVFAQDLVSSLLNKGFNGELCLNVNIPVRKIKGVKITRQGCVENIPHFNAPDYGTNAAPASSNPDFGQRPDLMTDRQAIMENYISITPLQRDQTDYTAAQSLLREASLLFPGKK